MKISKIYSNKSNAFKPIKFNEGFNVIIGEIRLPTDKNKDSHNLGKSKLAELIDFGFLKKRNPKTFLFQHFERFSEFIFFFEIKLNNGSFITIRRSVADNTKINFKRHDSKYQDFNNLTDAEWDYVKLPFDKAKLLLDSFLNLTSIEPWNYRMAISYALRGQDDFNDIFQLKKFGRGSDLNWKPYIGHILGFNAENLKENYELRIELDKISTQLVELQNEIGLCQGDEEEMLQDALSLKQLDALVLQEQLDTFNFDEADKQIVNELSGNTDVEIDELNRIRYYLSSNLKKLRNVLLRQPAQFDVNKTKRLFEEAGVLFGDSIKKSYEELLEFNRKITVERVSFVEKQILDIETQLIDINNQLSELNTRKSCQVSFLTNTSSFDKFREVSSRLLIVNTEINVIRRKLEISEQVKFKQAEARKLNARKTQVIDNIRLNKDMVTKSDNSIYKVIKENFTKFVKVVLDKDGLISTDQNSEGNLVFHAGFIDSNFKFTSEADGCSYKKILSMGYDLAVNLAYSNKNFVRFIYHDGGLETLDRRKKIEFLKYVRTIPQLYGTQYILTLIDSDLPDGITFNDDEIALILHDDGDDGLLFKMPSW